MKVKWKHVVKYWKMLTDTSAFTMVKEYQIKGDRPLKPLPTYLDTLWCKLRYGMSTKEYFYYGFYNKSQYARRSYLSSAEHTWKEAYRINDGDKSLFEEKINAYQAFKKFYRREALFCTLPAENWQGRGFRKKARWVYLETARFLTRSWHLLLES